MPMNFNSDRDDEWYIRRSTGPRRERPAACPECGEDVPDRPFFGDVTCGRTECRDAHARRRPDAWLAQRGTR